MATVKLDGGPANPRKPPPAMFLNPNVGRRTGIDILAGKNIRKDEDGNEIFADYFSDTDESSYFDKTISTGSVVPTQVAKPLVERRVHKGDGGETLAKLENYLVSSSQRGEEGTNQPEPVPLEHQEEMELSHQICGTDGDINFIGAEEVIIESEPIEEVEIPYIDGQEVDEDAAPEQPPIPETALHLNGYTQESSEEDAFTVPETSTRPTHSEPSTVPLNQNATNNDDNLNSNVDDAIEMDPVVVPLAEGPVGETVHPGEPNVDCVTDSDAPPEPIVETSDGNPSSVGEKEINLQPKSAVVDTSVPLLGDVNINPICSENAIVDDASIVSDHSELAVTENDQAVVSENGASGDEEQAKPEAEMPSDNIRSEPTTSKNLDRGEPQGTAAVDDHKMPEVSPQEEEVCVVPKPDPVMERPQRLTRRRSSEKNASPPTKAVIKVMSAAPVSRKRYSEELETAPVRSHVPESGEAVDDKERRHTSDEETSDEEGIVLMHYSSIDQEEDDNDDVAHFPEDDTGRKKRGRKPKRVINEKDIEAALTDAPSPAKGTEAASPRKVGRPAKVRPTAVRDHTKWRLLKGLKPSPRQVLSTKKSPRVLKAVNASAIGKGKGRSPREVAIKRKSNVENIASPLKKKRFAEKEQKKTKQTLNQSLEKRKKLLTCKIEAKTRAEIKTATKRKSDAVESSPQKILMPGKTSKKKNISKLTPSPPKLKKESKKKKKKELLADTEVLTDQASEGQGDASTSDVSFDAVSPDNYLDDVAVTPVQFSKTKKQTVQTPFSSKRKKIAASAKSRIMLRLSKSKSKTPLGVKKNKVPVSVHPASSRKSIEGVVKRLKKIHPETQKRKSPVRKEDLPAKKSLQSKTPVHLKKKANIPAKRSDSSPKKQTIPKAAQLPTGKKKNKSETPTATPIRKEKPQKLLATKTASPLSYPLRKKGSPLITKAKQFLLRKMSPLQGQNRFQKQAKKSKEIAETLIMNHIQSSKPGTEIKGKRRRNVKEVAGAQEQTTSNMERRSSTEAANLLTPIAEESPLPGASPVRRKVGRPRKFPVQDPPAKGRMDTKAIRTGELPPPVSLDVAALVDPVPQEPPKISKPKKETSDDLTSRSKKSVATNNDLLQVQLDMPSSSKGHPVPSGSNDLALSTVLEDHEEMKGEVKIPYLPLDHRTADAAPKIKPKSKKASVNHEASSRGKEIHNDSTLEESSVPKLLPVPERLNVTPGVRRSRRHHIPRLDSWRQQRVIYEESPSGNLMAIGIEPGFENQIGISPKTKAKLNQERRALKQNDKTKRPRKKMETTSEHELSIHYPSRVEDVTDSVPQDAVAIMNPNMQEEQLLEITRSHRTLVWVGPGGDLAKDEDPFVATKCFSQASFSSGYIKIRPAQSKPLQILANQTMVFTIKYGKLKVQVHENVWIMESDDSFIVPVGNSYKIENLRDDEATLIYFSTDNAEL